MGQPWLHRVPKEGMELSVGVCVYLHVCKREDRERQKEKMKQGRKIEVDKQVGRKTDGHMIDYNQISICVFSYLVSFNE